jgi:hypothetical protein
MNLNKYVLIFLILILFQDSNSQIVNPKIWLTGYNIPKRDTSSPDTGIYDTQFGGTFIDFRVKPIKLKKNIYTLSSSSHFVYNLKDSLVLYTNGSRVFNGKHRLIQGSDSLSYGSDWRTSPFSGTYFAEYNISLYPSAMIWLPNMSNPNQYYLLSHFINPDTINYKLTYSLVDMSLNGGLGKMIKKEVLVKAGDFTETIAATKHANGRDWWIITREYKKKEFTIILFDSTGFKIKSDTQKSGWDLADVNIVRRNFISKMSWSGKYFASFSHKGLEVFDFDRCTGILSNRREFPLLGNDTVINFSLCFSKDDKLLYANSLEKIFQINLSTNTYLKVADLVTFYDTLGTQLPVKNVFGPTQLTPDNKIFIASTSGSKYLSVIDSPDIVGIGCNVKQQSLKLLTFNIKLPSFPNYELGAMTVACKGSGIGEGEGEEVSVYPNPAYHHLYIQGINSLKPTPFKIYDLIGREILIGETSIDIDVSPLPIGNYILKLIDDNYSHVVKRFEVRR